MFALYLASLLAADADANTFAVYPDQQTADVAFAMCELAKFGRSSEETRRRLHGERPRNVTCSSRVVVGSLSGRNAAR